MSKNTVEILAYYTQEFIDFASKMKELGEQRQALITQFNAVRDKFKQDIANIDSSAAALKADFDNFKKQQQAAQAPQTPAQ